jgi:glycosyltransferase involved in cell wall biosynthesis
LVVKVALDVSAVPEHLAGAGRYIYEVARRLPTSGVTTTLVSRRNDGTRWRAWSPDAAVAPIVPVGRLPRLLFEAVSLGTSEEARAADVWHGPHYTMPRRGKTPTVVTIHDLTFFTNPEWHERSKAVFFRRAISYAASHADVLISVSDFTAKQIDELLPGHAPVVVAPHGVDLNHFAIDDDNDVSLLRAHQLPVDVPYVFFLGTVEPRKGLDVLLRAFDIMSRNDTLIELWIAGQTGWGLKNFGAEIAGHPAASRIRRLGFIGDDMLPVLFRQSRAVAYPSRGEGFGLPVLEALACGASVVTSANTVMADVAGNTAILVNAGDATALAHELSRTIASSDADRATHSQQARARAELFTWDVSMARHLEAYELARRGR